MFTFAFMHYPYLVRILFGIPFLHLFKFLSLVIFSVTLPILKSDETTTGTLSFPAGPRGPPCGMKGDPLCSQHFEYGSNNSHVTLRHNMRLQSAPPPRTLHVTLIKLRNRHVFTFARGKFNHIASYGHG